MDIEVRLFAALQQGRFRRKKLDIAEGSTVADVCLGLGIGADEAAIVMVNGVGVGVEHSLRDGDTLSLFPMIGGG